MPTPADKRAMQIYLGLMNEAKARAFSINTITGQSHLIPVPLIREYCFLQLRMLCEIIAMGCLVAHGDITNTKYFQKEAYKADDILRRLEDLHADFYPCPVRPVFNPGHIHLDDVPSDWDYLTKEKLIRLYGRCGDMLHKGKMERISRPAPIESHYSDIERFGQQVLNLLSAHRISRIGRQFHLVAILHDVNGQVAVAIAESSQAGSG